MLTIIIPAHNEQSVIPDCLQSLLEQRLDQRPVEQKEQQPEQRRAGNHIEVIISANGCTDATVSICQSFQPAFENKGFSFQVLETSNGNKIDALNLADSKAAYSSRLYLDADVILEPALLRQALILIDNPQPVYFSGTLSIPSSESFFSNAYSKIWIALPYIRDAVTGIGCYGVNPAGRALWEHFPAIHSDDKYVRLLFSYDQCKKTSATYQWPVPQGLLTLIKVRARWIKGTRQLRSSFPVLYKNHSGRFKTDTKSLKTMISDPVSTLVFIFVYTIAAALASLGQKNPQLKWTRAR